MKVKIYKIYKFTYNNVGIKEFIFDKLIGGYFISNVYPRTGFYNSSALWIMTGYYKSRDYWGHESYYISMKIPNRDAYDSLLYLSNSIRQFKTVPI